MPQIFINIDLPLSSANSDMHECSKHSQTSTDRPVVRIQSYTKTSMPQWSRQVLANGKTGVIATDLMYMYMYSTIGLRAPELRAK